jgi:Domain of unknown function (DUF4149)
VTRPWLRVGAAWLAGVWTGLIAALGFVAAPVLFATLPRADAGRAAARLFEIDAYAGLAFGAALLVLGLRRSHDRAAPGSSRFNAQMLLSLGALFCIVAGHFALQPMIDSARSGEPGPSFAVLHGVASGFFVVKFVVVAVLAWRLAAGSAVPRAADATAAAPTS